MKMTKRAAAVFGLAATTVFCTGAVAACEINPSDNDNPRVYGPSSYFEAEDDPEDISASEPSITSQWKIESWTIKGETSYALSDDDESRLPKFHSDDGKTFFLTITGENEYHGDLIPQEDGTYQLKHGDDPNILTAGIDGNKLTITLPSGTYLTFVTKED